MASLPTPEEASSQSASNQAELEAVRTKLAQAINESGGKLFTYRASLIPTRAVDRILAELSEAGWKSKLVPDQLVGDYYVIEPRN